ncbi:hypothetical protein SGFS_023160 [Streptomyces graminofaciens]|uniref:Uncharacterized protein n=1 Tax=Streptomyces graminofaciens TaxID=68212 RepID=A0ABN5VE36_9ACTN|nr:hypothetical protein SGFS_023160 [Streptomyces graminofaciens]
MADPPSSDKVGTTSVTLNGHVHWTNRPPFVRSLDAHNPWVTPLPGPTGLGGATKRIASVERSLRDAAHRSGSVRALTKEK